MPPKVEFGIWGRTLAVFGCAFLTVNGIPVFFYPGMTGLGVYCVVVGPIFLLFLWPFWHLKQLLFWTQKYPLMAVLMCAMSVYPFFSAPTVLPGVVLALSGILYLIAAIRCEKHLSAGDLAAADENLWMKM
jgi:hypothetical protein